MVVTVVLVEDSNNGFEMGRPCRIATTSPAICDRTLGKIPKVEAMDEVGVMLSIFEHKNS